jgi:hypothetical protein
MRCEWNRSLHHGQERTANAPLADEPGAMDVSCGSQKPRMGKLAEVPLWRPAAQRIM